MQGNTYCTGYFGTWDFHYNDQGLADEWTIDQPGLFRIYKMKYDKFNKVIEAPAYDVFGNLVQTNHFTYSGNQIVKQEWNDIVNGGSGKMLFSHNSKGQIVSVEDAITDINVFFTYDNMGNCIRHDYYIGKEIFFSDRYQFDVRLRDPLLTVSGVDFLFAYYGATYFDKLWYSRNLSIVYDIDGNPFVINDFDASKTDISTGNGNFPTSINYYDKVSESPLYFSFGNSCNGNNFTDQESSSGNRTSGINKAIKHPSMLLLGSAKSIKEKLQELRKQYLK